MKSSSSFQQLKNHFLKQCEWFAFREIHELTIDRQTRNGKLDRFEKTIDHGLFVEVYFQGHFSSVSTRDLSSEGIRLAFDKAIYAAQLASENKIFYFPLSVRPCSTGIYKTSESNSPSAFIENKSSINKISESSILDGLLRINRALKVSEKITTVRAKLRTVHTQQSYLSSSGAEWQQFFEIVMTDFSATAENSFESQTRSDNGGLARCYQMSLHEVEFESMSERALQIGSEACELLEAPNCPSHSCDLILAPDQMLLQIHESIGHPLELDRILGDERNFAGWSFVKPNDFGHLQYGSKLMNVTFDPTIKSQLASYSLDETGHIARKKYLIKDGILQKGLGSLESQTRLNLPGVANARSSSWNRPAIDRMANINLEPGRSSLRELISKVEHGLLMQSNRSWSIDDYRNKFQFGCEYAQVIVDGQIKHTVKNPNYRGRTIEFWNSLKDLGNDSEHYGSPFCGKGEPSQLIRVGHSSPSALFANVEVFGGGH